MRSERQIWKTRFGAFFAPVLVCALCASARATQDSASTPAATKPATTNKTASSTHKSTASSGAHSTSSNTPAKTHTASSKKHSRKKTARVRGQQKIDPERAEAIQEALIREHYLTGTPAGEWNATSEAAMRRYQQDNGWQTVVVPDSRALIKLGLGPSKDHLLNPDSAMTMVPDRPKSQSASPTSQPGSPTSQPAAPTSQPAPVAANPAAPAAAPSTPLQNTTTSPQ